jgi:hypothetical protein
MLRIALAGLLALDCLLTACHRAHRAARAEKEAPVVRVVEDTTRVSVFKDTGRAIVFFEPDRKFDTRRSAQRDSLRALLRKERALWRARMPRDYAFLLRVSCFCPGQKGWLSMEVRADQPVRAWDRTGRTVALTDWNTLSIDGLFDNLERSIDRDGSVELTFDTRWHFPTYVRTVAFPGPDSWGIIEARGFRPIP